MQICDTTIHAFAICCPQQDDGPSAPPTPAPVSRTESTRSSNASIGGGGGGGLMGEMSAILARRWVTPQV